MPAPIQRDGDGAFQAPAATWGASRTPTPRRSRAAPPAATWWRSISRWIEPKHRIDGHQVRVLRLRLQHRHRLDHHRAGQGQDLEEAKEITWQQASDALGGLPADQDALLGAGGRGPRAAIRTTRSARPGEGAGADHGEEIERRLKHVMNPVVGLDIVRTKLVKDVELRGRHRAHRHRPRRDHQFATAITEEIMEKIEPLWDVDQVDVEFTG